MYHKSCNAEQLSCTETPKRLLSTSMERGSNVLLVETKGRKCEYAALSDCWGKTQNVQITKETVSAFVHEGISYESLPKTIQEAVILARELKYQYI
jgi:hypothetical protein